MRAIRRLGTASAAAIVVAVLGAATVASSADMETAKDNYASFCEKCHGASGHGDGPAAAVLQAKPRDLSDCDRMGKVADEQLFKAIKEGGEAVGLSKDMAAWKNGFSDEEMHDLVAYIRAFCSP